MTGAATGRREALLAVMLAAVVVVAGMLTAVPTADEAHARSGQTLRIAYAEEPVAWHPALSDLPASIDLAALWGLPLYRYDHAGQLRPGLAADARVDPGEDGDAWVVEVELREGRWSDGEPVVADDVVATVEALRDLPRGDALLGPLVAVEALDAATVRLAYDGPYGRWPDVLAGGWSVLPAHVLDAAGLAAYELAGPGSDGPVSGGPFALDVHDPGLRAVFTRHDDSALGAPELDRIEVYFTPSYETALGLIAERRVDAALGYLAPHPVSAAGRVEDVAADAPLGGTWTRLAFDPETGLDAEQRRAVSDAVGVGAFVDGLLSDHGVAMTGAIPGVEGPWSVERESGREVGEAAIALLVSGRQPITGVTGRMLQRDIRLAGADVELVRLDLDEEIGRQLDVGFEVRRDGPRPALAARVPDDAPADVRAVLDAADAAAAVTSSVWSDAQIGLHEVVWDRPLFQVAVAHAWRVELGGVRASSWPGIGLWDVTAWRWGEDGPPEQVPTIDEAREE